MAFSHKPTVDLTGSRIRGVNLRDASLVRAVLDGADLSYADLRGADLAETSMVGAILKGADLRNVKNLTHEQINQAIIDGETRLPDYLVAA